MHGNVWEWCQDYWQNDLSSQDPQVDPQGPENGEFRVVRGGSWFLGGRGVRSAVRGKFASHFRNSRIGFRIALSPEEKRTSKQEHPLDEAEPSIMQTSLVGMLNRFRVKS